MILIKEIYFGFYNRNPSGDVFIITSGLIEIARPLIVTVNNIRNLMACVQAFWAEERKEFEDKLAKITAERDALQNRLNSMESLPTIEEHKK